MAPDGWSSVECGNACFALRALRDLRYWLADCFTKHISNQSLRSLWPASGLPIPAWQGIHTTEVWNSSAVSTCSSSAVSWMADGILGHTDDDDRSPGVRADDYC